MLGTNNKLLWTGRHFQPIAGIVFRGLPVAHVESAQGVDDRRVRAHHGDERIGDAFTGEKVLYVPPE